VRALFKKVYASQLADESPNGNVALATKLLDDAAKTKDAPIDRFVMLAGARKAAVIGGSVELAISADSELCRLFAIDLCRSRLDLITRLLKTARDPQSDVALAAAARQQAGEASEQGEYALAQRFADAGVTAAKSSGDVSLTTRANAAAASTRAVVAAYAQLEKPLAILRKDPKDPDANLAVGRFYCLTVGRWPTGLKFLAAGSDAPLRAAARADREGVDAASIARQWRALAEHGKPAEKHQLRLRAAKWYRDALKTADGLARVKLEGELADLNSGPFRADSKVLNFSNDRPSETILDSGVGLAALLSIRGHFQGDKEKAGVLLSDTGAWTSSCESDQGELDSGMVVYARSDGLGLNAEVKEYHWESGDPKVRMIGQKEGFCFVSFVSGHFAGDAERVSVTIGQDGFWYLDCATKQDLWARAISVKPTSPHTFSTAIREVSWKPNQPPMKLCREDEGMCFLSSIQGGMWDRGDSAGLQLRNDGWWYLQGSGHILETRAIVIGYLPDAR